MPRITQVAFAVAPSIPIDALAECDVVGLARLRAQGFERVCKLVGTIGEVCEESIRRTLQLPGVSAGEVDAIVACNSNEIVPSAEVREISACFARAGCSDVATIFLTGQDCSGSLSALQVAAALVSAGSYQRVMVLVYGYRGPGDERVSSGGLSVFSDGAASCIVSNASDGDEILYCHTASIHSQSLEGGPFTEALDYLQQDVEACLVRTGLTMRDLSGVYPTNLGILRTELLTRWIDCPVAAARTPSQLRFGHVHSCDNLINLALDSTEMTEDRGPYLLVAWSHRVTGAAILMRHQSH